jgi:hypothetical protein
MTGDPGNPSTLVALDTDANLISVVRINPVNVTVSPIAQFTVSSGIDDLAIGLNAPYMIGGGTLFRTNGGITGVAQTLALDPAGFYSGLTVPEPSSVALASFGLLGLVALGWRKAGRRAIG